MTTYTDDFNRADGAVGNSPIGSAYQGSGSWTIASNRVVPPSGTYDTLVFDSGDTDVDISVDIIDNPSTNNLGLTLRWSDNNNWLRVVCDQTNTYVEKRVAGSVSTLTSYATGNPAGKTLRVTISGNVYETFFNGVSQGTQTDAFNNTATRHGLNANNTTGKMDNLSVATLLAPTPVSATDSATATDAFAVEVDIIKAVTDSLGANDRAVLNDNAQTWGELVHLTEAVSVERVPSIGDYYTATRYPYGALVSPSTHTYARVENYEEILGTENQ